MHIFSAWVRRSATVKSIPTRDAHEIQGLTCVDVAVEYINESKLATDSVKDRYDTKED